MHAQSSLSSGSMLRMVSFASSNGEVTFRNQAWPPSRALVVVRRGITEG